MIFAKGEEAKGHARKSTGSYYTPDALVQALLDTALDPVLNRIESDANDPAEALLGVSVLDPACGSGHFLLAAARRIATRLAAIRAQGVASADDFRVALRDVVRTSIYGVDRNPMAVELTKVALWIETVEPGKPLGFLDTNIRCGDALVGILDVGELRRGIPDAAYRPLTGDDSSLARILGKQNRAEREGQGILNFDLKNLQMPSVAPLAEQMRVLRELPENNPGDISSKRKQLNAVRSSSYDLSFRTACDLYIAAFFAPKVSSTETHPHTAPTTDVIWQAVAGKIPNQPLLAAATTASCEAKAFHWPLEFPDIISRSGFDAILSNPPWERIKLQEQEFFAYRDPEVANAPNTAARARMIAKLSEAAVGTRARTLYEEFQKAKRFAEASSLCTGKLSISAYSLWRRQHVRLVC
jgi:hypothetical protein